MNQSDQIIETIRTFNWWLLPKIGILFLLLLMVLFGLLVIRQIQLMEKVVSGTSKRPLTILAWLGLLISVFIFLLALLIL